MILMLQRKSLSTRINNITALLSCTCATVTIMAIKNLSYQPPHVFLSLLLFCCRQNYLAPCCSPNEHFGCQECPNLALHSGPARTLPFHIVFLRECPIGTGQTIFCNNNKQVANLENRWAASAIDNLFSQGSGWHSILS